jgi:hypothetical protein
MSTNEPILGIALLSIIATAVFNKRASSPLSSEYSSDEEDELSPKYCVHS